MRDLERGGDGGVVKQENAAFRKAALTDRDEGKHFTRELPASEALLCKEGRQTGREKEALHPSAPSSSSLELGAKNPALPAPVRRSGAQS